MSKIYKPKNGDIGYIQSKYIHVFPCAWRGHNGVDSRIVFDPESKYTTEHNLTEKSGHINDLIDTYIKSWGSADQSLVCCIKGYYFDIAITLDELIAELQQASSSSTEKGTSLIAKIRLESRDIYQQDSVKQATSGETTKALANIYDSKSNREFTTTKSVDLDNAIIDNESSLYYFTGLSFELLSPEKSIDNILKTNDTFTEHALKLATYTDKWEINKEAYLDYILKLHTDNGAISFNNCAANGDFSFAIGKNTLTADKYSFAEGTGELLNNFEQLSEAAIVDNFKDVTSNFPTAPSDIKYVQICINYGTAENAARDTNLELFKKGSILYLGYALQGESDKYVKAKIVDFTKGAKIKSKPESDYIVSITCRYCSTDKDSIISVDKFNKKIKYYSLQAGNIAAHAEGHSTAAAGISSHSEGSNTIAEGNYSHAEGKNTAASGINAHAEGNFTRALDQSTHSEGDNTVAFKNGAHSEGNNTAAYGEYSHTEGKGKKIQLKLNNLEISNLSSETKDGVNKLKLVIERTSEDITDGTQLFKPNSLLFLGYSLNSIEFKKLQTTVEEITSETISENPLQINTIIKCSYVGTEIPNNSFTKELEYYTIQAIGESSHAEGISTIADAQGAHSEGINTIVKGQGAHAEGDTANADGISSHSEGYKTRSLGVYSHAEGNNTAAEGEGAHAEGQGTKALGKYSHAEGGDTHADGQYSHAEGFQAKALSAYSHAEGRETRAINAGTHAEGYGTIAGTDNGASSCAHAEGEFTKASGTASHAEGSGTEATAQSSHAEGNNTEATAQSSHAEGEFTKASGTASHAEGSGTEATAQSSHAEGEFTKASGTASHAEGNNTEASGDYSHAEGEESKAEGNNSHAEGYWTLAAQEGTHTEGYKTKALGEGSHAEGYLSQTGQLVNSLYIDGYWAHAEGKETSALGSYSHTEGYMTKTNGGYEAGYYTHAEGVYSTASGEGSHAEGYWTTTIGKSSHAEGNNTKASGDYSHAEGQFTIAKETGQHVSGKYNADNTNALFIVGNGTSDTERSNILEVKSNEVKIKGNLIQGSSTNSTSSNSHAEGTTTEARGDYSHAEGTHTEATGDYSHAEGKNTTASGKNSHAEGSNTSTGTWEGAHVEGIGTIAGANYQHVSGYYNDITPFPLAVIGNGSGNDNRSNIVEVHDTKVNINGALNIQDTSGRPLSVGATLDDIKDRLDKLGFKEGSVECINCSIAPYAPKLPILMKIGNIVLFNAVITNTSSKNTKWPIIRLSNVSFMPTLPQAIMIGFGSQDKKSWSTCPVLGHEPKPPFTDQWEREIMFPNSQHTITCINVCWYLGDAWPQ